MIRNDNYRELDDLLDEDALRSGPDAEYGYTEIDEIQNAKALIMTPEQMAERAEFIAKLRVRKRTKTS